MKKICFIVTTPFTANAFLCNHIIKLSGLYDLTLCLNTSLYPLSEKLYLKSIKIIHIPLARKVSIVSDIKCFYVLTIFFLRENFDSVHSFTPKAGLLGMSSAFFVRVPRRFHTFTGQIWSNQSGLYRFFFKHVDWLIAKFATFIFADSASQIRFLLKEGVCKPGKITMLGAGSISGVDLSRFKPNTLVREQLRKELGVSERDCVYLFVGRLCRDKGLFDLLAAFTKIRAKHANTVLWVVGPDEEGVIALAKELFPEVYRLIKWIGPTFSPERYMQATDVLLLPSYREGFGSVIIEAAACQLPTIAYRIDGVIDAVVDGKTGILVEVGNINELEQQMELLLNNLALRKELGQFAKERVCNEFSSKIVSVAWLNFYEDILNKTHS